MPCARLSEWPILEPSVRPMQDNADDCGVFMCLYAQVRCRTVDGFVDTLHMDASDVKHFRRELRQALRYKILHAEILYGCWSSCFLFLQTDRHPSRLDMWAACPCLHGATKQRKHANEPGRN